MTEAEMIDEAKKAFIKRGFWPNDVMWACWLDAWKQSALMEREACQAVCISLGNKWTQMGAWGSNTEFDQCADAIRARGNK
jgi:hypothetical protein